MSRQNLLPRAIMLLAILAFAFWGCGDDETTKPEVPGNQPPNASANPSPANLAVNQENNVQLGWDCTDPDTADTITFDLYFGHSLPPPLIDSDLTSMTYDPGQLEWGWDYWWQVVAKDNHGHSTDGPVWKFATRAPGFYSLGSVSTPSKALSVTVSGTYAYVGTQTSGMVIYDISDPANPDSVGSYHNTGGHVYDIFVAGNNAYLAAYTDGLLIIDVSNPTNPTKVGEYNPGTPTPFSKYVYVVSDTAFVADELNGMWIIDAKTNPSNPGLIGSFADTTVRAVQVSGDYAFLAVPPVNTPDSGLVIVDISDPTSPSLAGKYQVIEYAYDVYVVGNYAYVSDYYHGLKIVNISNPSAPSLVGYYDSFWKFARLTVSGDYALMSHYDYGLYVLDISTPAIPTLVDTLDTPTAGGHGQDVSMSGDYIYVAADADGLQVIRYIPQ